MFAFVVIGVLLSGAMAEHCVNLDRECGNWGRHGKCVFDVSTRSQAM